MYQLGTFVVLISFFASIEGCKSRIGSVARSLSNEGVPQGAELDVEFQESPCTTVYSSNAFANSTHLGCQASDGANDFESFSGLNNQVDAGKVKAQICHKGLDPTKFKFSCYKSPAATKLSPNDKYSPLRGGTAITNSIGPNTWGTLGLPVYRGSNMFFLTSASVALATKYGGQQLPVQIFHPVGSAKSAIGSIDSNSEFSLNDKMDAAVVPITKGIDARAYLFGPDNNLTHSPLLFASPTVGKKVFIIGAGSGLGGNFGRIETIDGQINIRGEQKSMSGQIVAKALDIAKPMLKPGDSGAVLLSIDEGSSDLMLQVLGVVHSIGDDGSLIATPIDPIKTQFGFSLFDNSMTDFDPPAGSSSPSSSALFCLQSGSKAIPARVKDNKQLGNYFYESPICDKAVATSRLGLVCAVGRQGSGDTIRDIVPESVLVNIEAAANFGRYMYLSPENCFDALTSAKHNLICTAVDSERQHAPTRLSDGGLVGYSINDLRACNRAVQNSTSSQVCTPNTNLNWAPTDIATGRVLGPYVDFATCVVRLR